MIPKNFYRIFGTLFFAQTVLYSHQSCPRIKPPEILKILTDDMGLYKTNTNEHEGHLIAHSVWTARTIDKWFTEKKFWTERINPCYKKIAVWGGFLHDIGKAGHFRSPYHDIPEHPSIGFHYLAGFTSNKLKHFSVATNYVYHLTPSVIARTFKETFKSNQHLPHEILKKMVGTHTVKTYSFDWLFNALNFSQQERAIVSILSGIHWEFGHVMQHKASSSAIKNYFVKLQELVTLTNYNNKTIDENIVRLAILITAADARASAPEGLCIVSEAMLNHSAIAYDQKDDQNDYFIDWENGISKRDKEFESAYERFEYETKGKRAREKILQYFNKDYAFSQKKLLQEDKNQWFLFLHRIGDCVVKMIKHIVSRAHS